MISYVDETFISYSEDDFDVTVRVKRHVSNARQIGRLEKVVK